MNAYLMLGDLKINMTRRIKHVIKNLLFKAFIFQYRSLHRFGVLPFSRNFGIERGSPVGRYYVENFLLAKQTYVKGRCLEFGQSRYKSFFPFAEKYEVIDIVNRRGVNYVCDIHNINSMPKGVFNTIICTQVFEHLAHPEIASRSIYELLAQDGVLLLTAPFINPVHYIPTDFRRFTPECLQMILEEAGLVVDEIDFGGNSLVSTGSLLGMVQEDFSKRELELKDPVYPYNVCIRAHRAK